MGYFRSQNIIATQRNINVIPNEKHCFCHEPPARPQPVMIFDYRVCTYVCDCVFWLYSPRFRSKDENIFRK